MYLHCDNTARVKFREINAFSLKFNNSRKLQFIHLSNRNQKENSLLPNQITMKIKWLLNPISKSVKLIQPVND